MFDGCGNGNAPVVLRFLDDAGEITIEEKIVERGIAFISFDNAIEKFCANDAPTAPDRGDVAEVQVPFILRARCAQQFHSLRIGNDLRGVERMADCIDKLRAIAGKLFRFRLRKNFR